MPLFRLKNMVIYTIMFVFEGLYRECVELHIFQRRSERG